MGGVLVVLFKKKRKTNTYQSFHQMRDRHARRYGVGVHDDVRFDAVEGEREVFWRVDRPARAFLTVPRAVACPARG